jgi:hypothetical protein
VCSCPARGVVHAHVIHERWWDHSVNFRPVLKRRVLADRVLYVMCIVFVRIVPLECAIFAEYVNHNIRFHQLRLVVCASLLNLVAKVKDSVVPRAYSVMFAKTAIVDIVLVLSNNILKGVINPPLQVSQLDPTVIESPTIRQ